MEASAPSGGEYSGMSTGTGIAALPAGVIDARWKKHHTLSLVWMGGSAVLLFCFFISVCAFSAQSLVSGNVVFGMIWGCLHGVALTVGGG